MTIDLVSGDQGELPMNTLLPVAFDVLPFADEAALLVTDQSAGESGDGKAARVLFIGADGGMSRSADLVVTPPPLPAE